jgi:hypothetical protein
VPAQARPEVNHEVQLHLLAAAEGAEGAPRVPQSLDAVVRQLKAALPSADYRVAASFINRVRDGGVFEVRTVSLTSLNPARASNGLPAPTSFQLTLSGVKLIDPASPQPSINILQFRLGMKAPVWTGVGEKSGGPPVVQYEDVGLSTMLSVREGEPTLVGTLGAPGQTFAVVITVRRTR